MNNSKSTLTNKTKRFPVLLGVSRDMQILRWLTSFFLVFFGMMIHTTALAGTEKNPDPMQQVRDLSGQYDKTRKQVDLSWKLSDDAGIETLRISYSINGKDFKAAAVVWVLPHGTDEYRFRHPVKRKYRKMEFRITDDRGNTKTIAVFTR